MPIHDWTRVSPNTFHDFHGSWITHLKETLNEECLARPYYAMSEQRTGDVWPDVLTLQAADGTADGGSHGDHVDSPGIALAEAPPKVRIVSEFTPDALAFLPRRRSLVIRYSGDDSIIAIVEILSPGNKQNRRSVEQFLDKVMSAFENGIHLLLVDLLPPTRLAPRGIHGLVCDELGVDDDEAPIEGPLTLVSYRAGATPTAYVEPIAVGDTLTEMPLFLTDERYVNVPLQPSYDRAFRGMSFKSQHVLSAPATDN